MLAMFKKQIKIDLVNYEVINRRISSIKSRFNAMLKMLCESRDVDDLKAVTCWALEVDITANLSQFCETNFKLPRGSVECSVWMEEN